MLVVYLLTRTRNLKIKFVKDNKPVFRHKGKEYKIDPEAIYTKRALGFKKFFWSMYMQDYPAPLKFKAGMVDKRDDVPLDDVAYILNKIRMGIVGEIGVIVSIVTLFCVIFMLMQQNGLIQ